MLLRSQGPVCLLLALVAVCFGFDASHALGAPPAPVFPQVEWEDRIEAALNTKGDWDFFDAPLIEVCRTLQERLGIDVALDTIALEDFGIDTRTPITRVIRGVSARSFLRLTLNELELIYTTRYGALWITTPESAEGQLKTRVYPVGDLLVRDPVLSESSVDYDSFIQAITSVIHPDAWDMVGGPGAIEGVYESLVVSQASDIHEQIAELLSTYREIIADHNVGEEPKQTVYLLGEDKATAEIRRLLDHPFTAEFKDASLKEVLESISEQTKIPIVIDTKALEDFGIDASVPITEEFADTPLHFVLVRILNEHEVTYIIRDEVLVITTPEQSEAQQIIGLYPVRDLVQQGESLIADPSGASNVDFDSLIAVIESTVAPDSWEAVGGPSSIGTLLPMPTIVIAKTQDVHEQIASLLTSLRAAKKMKSVVVADPTAIAVRSYPLNVSDCSSDEIAKLVMRATEPGTWNDQAGTFVQGLGSSLIVKHNANIHRRVQRLLNDVGATPVYGSMCLGPCGVGLGGGGSSGAAETNAAPAANPAPTSGGGFF